MQHGFDLFCHFKLSVALYVVSENSDTEDDLSEIRALNSGKTSASGEAVGYMSNLQLPLNQKGMLFHLL